MTTPNPRSDFLSVIVDEGTISFWCKHEHPNWTSNSAGYNFGTFEVQQMKFRATKHPDCRMDASLRTRRRNSIVVNLYNNCIYVDFSLAFLGKAA